MKRIIRTARAERDMAEIVTYISRDNASAAFRWIEELEALFRRLASEPLLCEEVVMPRSGVLRRTMHGKYVVYYREFSEGVRIVGVIHGARDHSRLL